MTGAVARNWSLWWDESAIGEAARVWVEKMLAERAALERKIDTEQAGRRGALWHRLLRRSASESGRLCHGDGAASGVPAGGGR